MLFVRGIEGVAGERRESDGLEVLIKTRIAA